MRLFFRPRKLRQRADEKVCWESGTRFQFQLHGRTIQGRHWGDGPGVLFVHGWDGRGSQFHKFVDSTIASGHRAIAFDGPAHGESDGSYTTYFEFTDVVRHILRGDSGMRVDKVVAHSFGAGAVINAMDKEKLAPDVVLIAPALTLEEFLQDSFQKLGFSAKLYRNLIEWLELHYHYNLRRDNPHRLLGTLSHLLLAIHDKKDKVVPHAITARMAEGYPNILLCSTDGLGHTKMLQEVETIDTVVDYLFGERALVSNL